MCFTQQPVVINAGRLRNTAINSCSHRAARRVPTSCHSELPERRLKPLSTSLSKALTRQVTQSIRSILSKIAQRRKGASRKQRQRVTTPEEWEVLKQEFDARANAGAQSLPTRQPIDSTGKIAPYLNPEQFVMLPYIESSVMAAMTVVLWMLGRHLQLDAFLLLFYPIPNMYIASRWGLSHADRTLKATFFVMFVSMGPMYAFQYMFNSGLLTYAYTRSLWYRWKWQQSLLIGAAAKAVGLALMFVSASAMLQYNAWELLTDQITMLLTSCLTMLSKLPLIPAFAAPSQSAVSVGLVVIICLHSMYHVFCTWLMSALVLIKVAERAPLKRVPREVPVLYRLLRRAQGFK